MTQRSYRTAYVPFTPTREQQALALRYVRLEIEAVVRILGNLHSAPASDNVLRGALLESLAVHLGVLRAFLESESRTVHYSGGIRQEKDDVLAADYGFPPQPLPISGAVRRELHRVAQPLAYSGQTQGDADRRLDLLALAIPILRRSATFAAHLLASTFLDAGIADRAAWEDLVERLQPFAIREPELKLGPTPVTPQHD